jgi:hypothetical protein
MTPPRRQLGLRGRRPPHMRATPQCRACARRQDAAGPVAATARVSRSPRAAYNLVQNTASPAVPASTLRLPLFMLKEVLKFAIDR